MASAESDGGKASARKLYATSREFGLTRTTDLLQDTTAPVSRDRTVKNSVLPPPRITDLLLSFRKEPYTDDISLMLKSNDDERA